MSYVIEYNWGKEDIVGIFCVLIYMYISILYTVYNKLLLKVFKLIKCLLMMVGV